MADKQITMPARDVYCLNDPPQLQMPSSLQTPPQASRTKRRRVDSDAPSPHTPHSTTAIRSPGLMGSQARSQHRGANALSFSDAMSQVPPNENEIRECLESVQHLLENYEKQYIQMMTHMANRISTLEQDNSVLKAKFARLEERSKNFEVQTKKTVAEIQGKYTKAVGSNGRVVATRSVEQPVTAGANDQPRVGISGAVAGWFQRGLNENRGRRSSGDF